MTRLAAVVCLTALFLPLGALPALGDPAGPTDYRSRVVQVEPAADGFEVSVIGGDAFIRLVADGGKTIDVIGYGGEPYLRFLPDGTVQENERSPARYVNEDRFAIVDVPEIASAQAEPVWRAVATDGSYSWHDHRTHWMNPAHPPFAEPGDQILEGVVPLVVDGVEVDVTVVSVWEEDGFPWSIPLGVMIALLAGVVAVKRRTLLALAAFTAVLAIAALTVAIVAFLSVPSETAPSVVLWLVPLTAAVLSVPALRSGTTTEPLRWDSTPASLLLVAALELLIWALVRREWLFAAILPTNLAYPLDRAVVASVMAGSVVVVGSLVLRRVSSLRSVSTP